MHCMMCPFLQAQNPKVNRNSLNLYKIIISGKQKTMVYFYLFNVLYSWLTSDLPLEQMYHTFTDLETVSFCIFLG